MRYLLLLCFGFFSNYCTVAQTFTLTKQLLPGLRTGDISWGDINSDGRLDFIQTGNDINAFASTRQFLNTTSGFLEVQTNIPKIFEGNSDWGDYDNDGDQDLLISGYSLSGVITRIYKNVNGNLTWDENAVLRGIDRGSVEWGDYDADGDLDILLSGQDGNSSSVVKLYQNNAGVFSELVQNAIEGVSFGQASWIDFDNDGDLDVMTSGFTGTSPNTGPKVSRLYKNNGGVFSEVFQNSFEGLGYSSLDVGDFDTDGDMDIILSGFTNLNQAFTAIYQNNGISFDIVFDGVLPQVLEGKVLWADTDNDGDLDAFVSGNIITGNEKIAKLYTNTGNGFVLAYSFNEAGQSAAAFADYDSDGDLDIFISGQRNDMSLYSGIYRNDNVNETLAGNANTLPSTPTNLKSQIQNGKIVFGWDESNDAETAQAGLTYNMYVRSEADTTVQALSLINGKRKIVKRGNTGHLNSWSLQKLTPGDHFWSVQSVDNSYAGSAFSTEAMIHINFPPKIKGTVTPLTTPPETSFLLTLNDLLVEDPDNTYPEDFSLTVYPGNNYSVVNNEITPHKYFRGMLSISVSVNDGTDESAKVNVSVEVPGVLGIDNFLENNFSIYPNPVSDRLNIRPIGLIEPVQLEIYSSDGASIYSSTEAIKDRAHLIDLSQLKSGIYILQVKGKNKVGSVKIVKE